MALLALSALLATSSGCFGYNSSAKKWAYVGDSVLIAGGGAAIASDFLIKDDSTSMTTDKPYEPPFSGAILAGSMLVTAGILGIIINATRPTVKTSR
ncbi:MAG: hypothetical protein HOQ28_13525 [Thermoleophilia bacterium]|nr:hypothetical protein [Thermoleophilia bacterium]